MEGHTQKIMPGALVLSENVVFIILIIKGKKKVKDFYITWEQVT